MPTWVATKLRSSHKKVFVRLHKNTSNKKHNIWLSLFVCQNFSDRNVNIVFNCISFLYFASEFDWTEFDVNMTWTGTGTQCLVFGICLRICWENSTSDLTLEATTTCCTKLPPLYSPVSARLLPHLHIQLTSQLCSYLQLYLYLYFLLHVY